MPVYLQTIEQIKRAVAVGEMAAGDQLPTVKQLATELAINPNTVAKAYRDLEREGVIETFPGKGSFVSAKMVGSARDEQVARLAQDMRRIIRDASALGVRREDLVGQFESEVQSCYGRKDDVVGHRNREAD